LDNVTPIEKAKGKRGRPKKERNPFTLSLVLKMNRDRFAPPDWPAFPHTFHVFDDAAGRRAVLEEVEPGLVVYRDEAVVTSAILRYQADELPSVNCKPDLSYNEANAVKNYWLAYTQPLTGDKRPLALAEKSTPGLAFRRLEFDAPASAPDVMPERFAEFLTRCSQPQALCAFIGSLFYPEADRQQYLYFYGEGQDGKGTLLRMLFKLLGAAAQSLQPKGKDDRFWNMKVYGKRLVMFPDCDDFRFFASPEFKSLTGNDPIYFEEKGRMGFTDIPNCKIIAASNHKPNITSQKSDMRRLIYCEVKPVVGSPVPNYENMLLAEAEAIVRYCKAVYEAAAPGHGPIPCEVPDDVAFEAEGDYLSIFNAYFESDPNGCVTGHQVREVLQREGIRTNIEARRVKECWERQCGVTVERKKSGMLYRGMRKRTAAELAEPQCSKVEPTAAV
jgi:hypothetical protein